MSESITCQAVPFADLQAQSRVCVQIFQGIVLASRDRFQKNSPLGQLPPFGGAVTSPEGYLVALWQHECQRVFADRMISLEDKAWITSAIGEVTK